MGDWSTIWIVVGCAVPAFVVALLVGMRAAAVPIRFPVVLIATLSLLALILPSLDIALALFELSGNSSVPEISGFVAVALIFLAVALGLINFELRYLVPTGPTRSLRATLVTVLLVLPLFIGAVRVQQTVSDHLTVRRIERANDDYKIAVAQMVERHQLPVPYGFWTNDLALEQLDPAGSRRQVIKPLESGTLHHQQESLKSMPARAWDGRVYVEDSQLPKTPWFELTENVARDVAEQLHEQGYKVYIAAGHETSSDNPGHVVTQVSQKVKRVYRDPIIYGVRTPGHFGYKRDFVMYDITPDPAPWASAPRIAVQVGRFVMLPRNIRELQFPLDDQPLFDCRIDSSASPTQR